MIDGSPMRHLARARRNFGEHGREAMVLAYELTRYHRIGSPTDEARVAIGVLGERGTRRDVPRIAPHLTHEYPLVRYYAKRAIEELTGAPVPIDVGQPAAEIAAQLQRWMAP